MGHVIGIDTTYTGNPVSFIAAHGGTMKSISVPFTYSQDLHGYANPWPGGGGKNLCANVLQGYINTNVNPRTFVIDNNSESAVFYATQGTTYHISSSITLTRSQIGHCADSDITSGETLLDYVGISGTYTWTATWTGWTVWYVYPSKNTSVESSLQVEIGSTATSYEPYSNICPISGLTGLSVYVSPTQDPDDATVYNVDWSTQAGTVYGGTVDVVTGVLTVDRASVNISSSWSWKKSNSYPGGFYVSIDSAGTGQKKSTPFICSHAKTVTATSQYVQGTCYCDAYINIRIMDGSDTVQDWKNYINAQITAGTPIQICYELATPVTYQLTPKAITALIGQNYIWSSNDETLSTVLTAPATGFAGWLIKCVTNGTPVEIPLKYMRAETYTVTPDQRMEWSAERDVTGVLHRETVQNLPPKIEFNTPLMTNSDINALNNIIKAAFTSYQQRNITIQFYDPERDQYWEWDCYMPDVKYHIRNADTVNNIINYEELRYAFIGY